MTTPRPLHVLLVDPSLFTAPYDAGLTAGLLTAGVEPTWAVRPTRPGDREELAPQYVTLFFYRLVDRFVGLPRPVFAAMKGFAHVLGLARLIRLTLVRRPDVVHFQWALVPALDALALLILRRLCVVVLTVHDTVPFNGDRFGVWQKAAFDLPSRLSDRVIVHTRAGRDALIRRGLPADKVTVIPHGPLKLHAPPSAKAERTDDRFTFVLFGEIKPYKGIDLLIEALGLLPDATRARARFIVAGRPRMDIGPLVARIAELGHTETIEWRPRRLSEEEMADLFAQADCFLFPYRQVDASGVYFLVNSLRKWIIATRVGIFAEDLEDGVHGALVPPNDAPALARAMQRAIVDRIRPPPRSSSHDWTTIGSATRDLYLRGRTGPTNSGGGVGSSRRAPASGASSRFA